MLNKIKCLLGFHDWDTKYIFDRNVLPGRFRITSAWRRCKRNRCYAHQRMVTRENSAKIYWSDRP